MNGAELYLCILPNGVETVDDYGEGVAGGWCSVDVDWVVTGNP